jgi:hypothetical protein
MKDTEKLQIYVTYKNGSTQAWGYDGKHFDSIAKVIADVQRDFPADFPTVYKNVYTMFFVWGEGLPLDDQLKDLPTKELQPVYGQELVDTLTTWLTELGVLENGN